MVDMRIEENRIYSFHAWPNNAPVDKERLARGGFFATGNYLEAQCAWCNKKISDWQYGDQVTVRHRRLDPLCPFLLNPNESGNVPIVSSSTISAQNVNDISSIQHEENLSQGNLKDEAVRLATFKNWPNSNISPQSLAKAGFYYINKSDHVRCAWCFGVIAKWEKGDSAFGEHQRFFPDCPRVQLGPLIEITSDGIRDLGIQQISPPRQPKYSSLDARLRTFVDWPIADIQQPEVLAKAGFYSTQHNDLVRCFHCYGGLRSWQKEDDPWFEHAKWFPHCQFIRLVKGVSFVSEVQSIHNQSSKQTTNPSAGYSNVNENNTSTNGISSSIGNSSASNINNSPMMVHTTTIDNAMLTEPVLQALEMGLNEGRIRNAVQRRLESTGRTYQTTEELIEAVLDRQADEEDEDSASERSSSLVREVSRILNNIFHPQNFNTEDEDEASIINNFNSSSSSNNFYHGEENPFNIGFHITDSRNYDERPEQNEIQLNSDEQSSSIRSESNPYLNIGGHHNTEPSNMQNIEGHRSSTTELTSEETSEKVSTAEENCSTTTATTGRKLSLEEENRLLKEARTCKVCMDEEVGVVFLPCAHFVTCVQCAPGVNSCPLCRSPIKGFVRTFLS